MGTIAYGSAKGTAFDQAETKDLEWYVSTLEKKVAEDPNGQYTPRNRKDAAEIRQILKARAGGTAAIVPTAAAQAQIMSREDVRKLEGTYHEPRKVRDAMNQAAAMGHLVTPATGCTDLPEGCSIALSAVFVDTANETYDLAGKRGLSKTALQKIGAAAGVSWDATQSGRLDNGADSNYCLWKAVGTFRKFDGSEVQLVATKEMDLRDGSAQIDALYERYNTQHAKWEREQATWERNGRSGKPPREPKEPTAQIREMRLHIAAHAETKAQLRALRAMGLRSAYDPAELQRPFIVAQLMFTGRTEDPVLREKFATMRATAMLGGARALYGVPPAGLGYAPPVQQFVAPPPVGRRGHVELDDEDDFGPVSDPEPGPPHGAPPPAAAAPPAPPSQDPPAAAQHAPQEAAPPQRQASTQRRRPSPQPPPNAGDGWLPEEEERARGEQTSVQT